MFAGQTLKQKMGAHFQMHTRKQFPSALPTLHHEQKD